MSNSSEFIAHVLEMMEPAGSASARAMFGAHGVYLDGLIVGIVDDDVLYLKTDAQTRPKFVTRDLILRLAQKAGMRLTTRQAAKYVPIAGQAMSAVMGYTAIRYLGEEHIKDCVRVAQAAQLMLPAPKARRRAKAV